jgi:competence protein CoiA
MQFYALNKENALVSAPYAIKQRDYICVECKNSVRLRSGAHRQAHFYHILPANHCTLHSKGMIHLMVQHHLKSLLTDVELECRFPSIHRIADVAWHSRKLIFEIQCSPISAEEIKNRTFNYQSIGYQVVWIFHDQRFNQEKLSSAEDAVQSVSHYFTNMNAQGKGEIYDQLSFINKRVRRLRLPPLSVDLSSPLLKPLKTSSSYLKLDFAHFLRESELPHELLNRFNQWPIFFKGDLMDRLQSESEEELLRLKLKEALEIYSQSGGEVSLFKKVGNYFITFYQILFRFFLEKACQ